MNVLPNDAPSQPQAGDPLELEIYGVKAVFRYCPPGTFLMGRPAVKKEWWATREPQHEVTLTRGFWLLETPVTQTLWKAVMGENPSYYLGVDARPVECVSWNDCAEFISKLNVAEYAPKGWVFDFPTEAEWEYACRAGMTSLFNVGDELTVEDANFGHNIDETTPVKSYKSNAWGFYDMHGNVWEWCKDWFCDYPEELTTDPQRSSEVLYRVIRGGSLFSDDWNCSSDCREIGVPGDRRLDQRFDVGFRLALRSVD